MRTGTDIAFSEFLLWIYGSYPFSLIIIAFAFVVAFAVGAAVIFARGFRF